MELTTMIAVALVVLAVIAAIYSRVTGGSSAKAEKVLPPQVPGPVARWYDTALKWAQNYDLPWQVVLAQIWQESTGDPNIVGANSDYGLMQVTPGAVTDLKREGYQVPDDWKFNPESNIQVGTAYLHLMRSQSGKLADALGKSKVDALEAYNEGFTGGSRDYGPDDYTNSVLDKARIIGYSA